MRLTKPSFKLKNSDQVVFSPSGKLLAQKGMSGTKISIWNIKNCELLAQHKIISNDDSIGFLPDEETMFVKNNNGELAFFKTFSGEIISQTGKNPLYAAGCKPIFHEVENYLYDGSSQGELIAWNINPLEKISIDLIEGYSIEKLVKDYAESKFFAAIGATVNSKESDGNKVGGSKILCFSKINDTENQEWLFPKEKELTDEYGIWKPIADMDFNSTLVIALKLMGQQEAPMIANLDIATGKAKFIYLESKYQTIWSVTSNDSVIISAVETSSHRAGMTWQESQKASEGVEEFHLYILDKNSLEIIDKVFWPEVRGAIFSPNGKSLAISSYVKSAYVDDYKKISNKLIR